MGEKLFIAVVMLLAVYAVADLVCRLAWVLLFPQKKQGYCVLPICGKRADAEYAVRQLAVLRWFLPSKAWRLTVLDMGLEEESATLATNICQELHVDFCSEKEWEEMVQNTLQANTNEVL